jgi:small-conductance mechanosensitive channel
LREGFQAAFERKCQSVFLARFHKEQAGSFNLRGWTDQYKDWIQVRSDLAVAIDEALIRENIAVA